MKKQDKKQWFRPEYQRWAKRLGILSLVFIVVLAALAVLETGGILRVAYYACVVFCAVSFFGSLILRWVDENEAKHSQQKV